MGCGIQTVGIRKALGLIRKAPAVWVKSESGLFARLPKTEARRSLRMEREMGTKVVLLNVVPGQGIVLL